MGARWMASRPKGCSYMQLFITSHLLSWVARLPAFLRHYSSALTGLEVEECAPCQPGDVVLMHPFLAHSSTENYRGRSGRVCSLSTRRRGADASLLGTLID